MNMPALATAPQTHSIQRYVWTHTGHTGVKITGDNHCQQWTSDNPNDLAMVRLNAVDVDSPDQNLWAADRWWNRDEELNRKSPRHLYCFDD